MMLGFGSRPQGNVVQPHQVANIERQANDWELVLRESHHRMKNTLTLLGASVRREFTRSGSTDLSIAVDRFEGRLVAFGRLYQLLSDDSDCERSVSPYFEFLCVALSQAILEPAGICCEAAIEEGMLPGWMCQRVALMVTELVTNAAKHAFPNRSGGMIRIHITCREGSWCCTVADNGTGVTGPLQGTGGRILDGLARSMRAEVLGETSRSGTRVKIVVPVLD